MQAVLVVDSWLDMRIDDLDVERIEHIIGRVFYFYRPVTTESTYCTGETRKEVRGDISVQLCDCSADCSIA